MSNETNNTFLINTDDFSVYGMYESIDAAEHVAARTEFNYIIVDEPVDLGKLLSGSELVTLYNRYRPEHKAEVTKFRDKATAIERTWDLLTKCDFEATPAKRRKVAPSAPQPTKPKADKPKADKSKRRSVAAAFRENITAGLNKEMTLDRVRAEFPDKNIPDRYYAWYCSDMKRKGLL
jgi:hypothetical protein